MNLRERAQAAYKAKIEREAEEEVRREFERRTAHVERLRDLCVSVLQLAEPPVIQWIEKAGYHWPVTTIESMIFSCPPDHDQLRLLIFQSGNLSFQDLTSLERLGEILTREYTLAALQDNTLIPLERSSYESSEK